MTKQKDNIDRKYPDFYWIPHEIRQKEGMQATDGYVYGAIYWFAKMKYQKCVASNDTIAEAAYTTAGTVSHSLARLEKAGFIQRIFNEKGERKEIIPLLVIAQGGLNHSSRGVEPQLKGDRATAQHIENIDKDNNKDNISKKSSKKEDVKYTPDDMRLAHLLDKKIKENYPVKADKETNFDQWADDIRKLREIDKATPEQIEVMICWVHGGELEFKGKQIKFPEHDFWSQNIQSAGKLRDQFFDKLYPQLQKQVEKNQKEIKKREVVKL